MIKESKNEYKKQFNNDKFFCVIYPDLNSKKEVLINKFKEKLTVKNIEYIDFTDIKYKM